MSERRSEPVCEEIGREFGACGVGFVAARDNLAQHSVLLAGLRALTCVEHRGALAGDGQTGDGAGVMAEIPWALFDCEPGAVAIVSLFLTRDETRRQRALSHFEHSFATRGLKVLRYREVPVRPEVLGPLARESMPRVVQAVVARPASCRTDMSFDERLYEAKQATRTELRGAGLWFELYFTSISTRTLVYKALCKSDVLSVFYPDLSDPRFVTRFCLFHRRFSTNTRTSWDKAQPLRLLAHNGEINTVAGNRSWSYSREQALGLAPDELLTHSDISDSGNLNEMAEALRFRSSIPRLEEALAIMIPPADERSDYYDFWGRAVEPWDGPALVTYCDGEVVGARLDRNGFRPARWMTTATHAYLASEVGVFEVDPASVIAKGTLRAGSGFTVLLENGKVHLRDPSRSHENAGANFDPRLVPAWERPCELPDAAHVGALHGLSKDELGKVLAPMAATGKEGITSMGDTARLALLSHERRSFYDFFYQAFAQVTNPPLDYLRERSVTDLRTYLGHRPNIFAPKELLPLSPAIALDSPVLSATQMAALVELERKRPSTLRILARVFGTTVSRAAGAQGLRARLESLAADALAAVDEGISLIILSDRGASEAEPPVPSLLALRAVVNALNREGRRLEASIVVDAGDIRSTHQIACAIGFGASAVCPWLNLAIAQQHETRASAGLSAQQRGENMRAALESGLLKIMSKMGISVVRSYQSSKLFSAVGLGPDLMRDYFPGLASRVGGYELEDLGELILRDTLGLPEALHSDSRHLLMEHPRGKRGERHSMYAARAKVVHRIVRAADSGAGVQAETPTWDDYESMGAAQGPVNLRHLLRLREPTKLSDAELSSALTQVEPVPEVLARFGSGAMSFGAISAESQRDLFKAMRAVGARCNSGEGGENPYYFVDGTTATTKQIASGRFGVNAEYLVTGDEIEIKVAQGAKPGEGGQLMGVKVDAVIALARNATPGVDLISPPPLHDIYSIEDLKQLIYELKQLHPVAKVCVKLVSGRHIGTVAVGVVKAGADIIQISGGDGGTGAAPISSMRHAGLPFELGLAEVHRSLSEQGLRNFVTLRVDGGLSTGKDVVMAAALGAEEFGFGKLLLVGQGCIMARICEKNRCPTGIATHDPKFKAKYKGEVEHVVRLLKELAGSVRRELATLGLRSLQEVVGNTDLLELDPAHEDLVRSRRILLAELLHGMPRGDAARASLFGAEVNALNQRIVDAVEGHASGAGEDASTLDANYTIRSTDRAVPARVCGHLARRSHELRMGAIGEGSSEPVRDDFFPPAQSLRLRFEGSAGQGFGAFMVKGLGVQLWGEANDSVCKSMSGGSVTLRPPKQSAFVAEENAILGNCALYGATGGELYARGHAGDRFAVRNSGARAVVEGAGLHLCEYMTGGVVVVLGPIGANAGAGMTGGELVVLREHATECNEQYVRAQSLDESGAKRLRALLQSHFDNTASASASRWLGDWAAAREAFVSLVPL